MLRPGRDGMRRYCSQTALALLLFLVALWASFGCRVALMERDLAALIVLALFAAVLSLSFVAGLVLAWVALWHYVRVNVDEEGLSFRAIPLFVRRVHACRWDTIVAVEVHTGRWSGRPVRLRLVPTDGPAFVVPGIFDLAQVLHLVRDKLGARIVPVSKPDPVFALTACLLAAFVLVGCAAACMDASSASREAVTAALFFMSGAFLMAIALIRKRRLFRRDA